MTGDTEAMGLTQRELLMEMRSEIRSLAAKIDSVARDQMLSAERRSAMSSKAALIETRLDEHDDAIADLRKSRDEVFAQIRLARWAFGSSLLASVLIVIQITVAIANVIDPRLP